MLRPSMKPMTWLLLLLVSIVGTDAARIVAHTASHSHHDLLEPHDMEDSSVISVRRDTTFDQFTTELAGSMEHHRLSKRALDWVFDEDAVLMRPHPPCTGLWLEFGVFTGSSINQAARYRSKYCGSKEKLYGFDTFTGLPEDWEGQADPAGEPFSKGAFSLGGNLPAVESNVELVKGLFSDSLPPFLAEHAAKPELTVSYLHVDCDLYAGAKDVFTILNDRIQSGTVIIFDELFNYPSWRDHEAKALFEWLKSSQHKLQILGMLGPLPGRTTAVDLDIKKDLGFQYQSAAFRVV